MNVTLPLDARAIQHGRAGLVSRSAAAIVDLLVVTVAVFASVAASAVWRYFFGGVGTVTLTWPSQLGLASLGGLLLAAYLTWGWAQTGRTIGKRVLGLAVVRASGTPISWPVAALRAVLYVVFPLGLLWCGVSRSNRSVQDMLLRTCVVYDWHGARRNGRPRS